MRGFWHQNFPTEAQYIGFCRWNRVFVADPEIVEQMRIHYSRLSPIEQLNGYARAAHYSDMREVIGTDGDRPQMEHEPA